MEHFTLHIEPPNILAKKKCYNHGDSKWKTILSELAAEQSTTPNKEFVGIRPKANRNGQLSWIQSIHARLLSLHTTCKSKFYL